MFVIEKIFEIRSRRPNICQIFEITWTIYSNSERSEQFLVTECFFNLFLEFSQISKNRTIIIQIGKKILEFRNITGKVKKRILGDYLTMPGLGLCQIPLIAKLHSDPFGEKIICNSLHQLKMFAQFLPKVIYP